MKAHATRLRFARAKKARTSLDGGENGAALIELALSLAILLTLIFGIINLSMGLFAFHYISEAAREGTRWTIVRGNACVSLTSCPATSTQVQNYVKGLGYGVIDTSKLTVTATWPNSGGTCPLVGICNTAGNLVRVKVQYAFPLSVPFVPTATWTMSSTSQMVIAQ